MVSKATKPKVYKFRKGTRAPTGASAQDVGNELQQLIHNSGSKPLTPEEVLKHAENNEVLHDWFEWDDSEAAHQHRLHQARYLLKSVSVIILTPEEKEVEVSITTSLPVEHEEDERARYYYETETLLKTGDGRHALLMQAWRELQSFRTKYAALSELAQVFEAIDKMSKKTS